MKTSYCRSTILGELLRKPDVETRYSWDDALKAAAIAIEKYSDDEMIAVNYNNLAYFNTSEKFAALDVAAAERYLDELIKRIPETQWDPVFPEFFHTKGCVLLAKYEQTKESAILREAYAAASEAVRLFPDKREHKTLKETIEALIANPISLISQ